jgi:hypothetical protein
VPVPKPRKSSGYVFICVGGINFVFVSTIYLLSFGTVSDGVVFFYFSFDQYYKVPVSESLRKEF